MLEEQDEKRLRVFAEAIIFYLEHPETIHDSVTKAYLESIKKMLVNPQRKLNMNLLKSII